MDNKLKILKDKLHAARARNQEAKTGTSCVCPSCGNRFIKNSYQQVFCKSKSKTKCKDKFWNTVDENKRDKINYHYRVLLGYLIRKWKI